MVDISWPSLLSGSSSRNRVLFSKLLSAPACSSQFDLHWASPHPTLEECPGRTATHLSTFCFFEFIFAFRDGFLSTSMCTVQLDWHWDSPKFPSGMQRICGPFVLKTVIISFERIFVLWHSLIWSFYFIQAYILYLWYIPPHSCAFYTFCLHQFFHISCGHTTDFCLGETDLPKASSSKISRGKYILFFFLARLKILGSSHYWYRLPRFKFTKARCAGS